MTWTRRGFLKVTTCGAVGAAVSQTDSLAAALEGSMVSAGRLGVPSPFVKNGKPMLVVVEGTDYEAMLDAGLEALGGLDKLVQKDNSVVLKPNLLKPQPYPVTTDPDFVFAVSRQVKGLGCEKVVVRDSPSAGGAKKDSAFTSNKYFEKGKAAGVEVVATDKQSDPEFLACQESRWELHPQILVDRDLLAADVIINLPPLKRHFIPGMTCALKNHFGCVHGSARMKAHQEAKNGAEGVRYFRRSIAEYADAVRSDLTIVDARSLLVKGGPSLGGGPAEVKTAVNRMILGADMVAVDAYGAELMSEHDETFSPAMADDTLEHAQALGLGVGDLKQVEVIEVTA